MAELLSCTWAGGPALIAKATVEREAREAYAAELTPNEGCPKRLRLALAGALQPGHTAAGQVIHGFTNSIKCSVLISQTLPTRNKRLRQYHACRWKEHEQPLTRPEDFVRN